MDSIKIITFTGSSGVGKTTIARDLFRIKPDWRIVLSITTREQRPSDLPGEYHYIHYAEFLEKESRGEFIWTTGVHGVRHGTLFSSVDEALNAEGTSLMLLTPEVIPTLRKYAPEKVLSFFLIPPSGEELTRRLHLRGESSEDIERRIEDCKQWLAEAKESGLPYVFIDSSGSIEGTTRRALNILFEKKLINKNGLSQQ